MSNKEIYKREAAQEILSFIEEVCFSKAYRDYRIDYGSNGQRDLIIKTIKERYNIEWK